MKTRTWRRTATASLATLALAGLAACGSGGGDAAGDGDGSHGSATTVRLVQGTESLLYSPIYIARKEGYFSDEGLDVQVTAAGGGSVAFASVLGGSGDIASAAFENNVQAAVKGQPLVAFAGLMDRYSNELVMRKDVADRLGLTAKSSVSDKIKALRGLKVGITSAGSATDDTLRYLLEREGLAPDRDVEIVPLKEGSVALAAIQHNRVQALLFPSPAPQQAIDEGTAVSLVNLADGSVPGLRNYLFIVLLATADFLQQHADVARKVARAIGRAESLVRSDPERAERDVHSFFPTLPDSAFKLAFEANVPAFPKTPAMSQASMKSVVRFVGDEAANLDLDEIATNRFVSAGG